MVAPVTNLSVCAISMAGLPEHWQSPFYTDPPTAATGNTLKVCIRANADIVHRWAPVITLRQNVTKVQLPDLYLRNLTPPRQAVD
jgi:hypothetical protein